MRSLGIMVVFLFAFFSDHAQVKIAAAARGKELTDTTARLKLFEYRDGTYGFTYQNVLSQKPDPSTIIFRNRAEASSFILDIKKAFDLGEGNISKVNYGNARISLIPTSNGSVFMRVEKKGAKISALEINRLTFRQINILQ
ncbi:MAG TPA: hypothetical protein VKR53_20035 [Puia sp.]|nr:hypothetical protein [Puia sp.]